MKSGLEYDLSVWEDGRASINFPQFEFKSEWFQSTAAQIEKLLGMTAQKTETTTDQFLIEYDNGCVFKMDAWAASIAFPSAVRQYEAAIRFKTELRWKPQSRVYAWAPVSDQVEALIEILHQTLAFLMYHSSGFDEEGQELLLERMSEIQSIVSAIRNGDAWDITEVQNLYLNTAAGKLDKIPQAWSDQFLALAGKAGAAL